MTCNYILDYPANLKPSKDPALIFTWLLHVMNPSFKLLFIPLVTIVALSILFWCFAMMQGESQKDSVLGENFLLLYTFVGSQYTLLPWVRIVHFSEYWKKSYWRVVYFYRNSFQTNCLLILIKLQRKPYKQELLPQSHSSLLAITQAKWHSG